MSTIILPTRRMVMEYRSADYLFPFYKHGIKTVMENILNDLPATLKSFNREDDWILGPARSTVCQRVIKDFSLDTHKEYQKRTHRENDNEVLLIPEYLDRLNEIEMVTETLNLELLRLISGHVTRVSAEWSFCRWTGNNAIVTTSDTGAFYLIPTSYKVKGLL